MQAAERLAESRKDSIEPVYSRRSFELVFTNFCAQYTNRVEQVAGQQLGGDMGFMGLAPNAPIKLVGRRLHEISQVMGDEPQWSGDDQLEVKEAILHAARRLAWNAVMGSVNQRYIDRLNEIIDQERRAGRHGVRHNLARIISERNLSRDILVVQNHALRDYFDSPLAQMLGNDSPEGMAHLLEHVPFMTSENRKALVGGISLEIAVKRHMQQLASQGRLGQAHVSYGSDKQDERGGDLVVIKPGEVDFIDVKKSMPKRFADGVMASAHDFGRGFRWLGGRDVEHKVVVWALIGKPVAEDGFRLRDSHMAHNLEVLAATNYL